MTKKELNKNISELTEDLDFSAKIYIDVYLKERKVLDVLKKNNFNIYNIIEGQRVFNRGTIYIAIAIDSENIVRTIKINNENKN